MRVPLRKPGLSVAIALLSVVAGLPAQAHANKLSVPNDPTVKNELARAKAALEADGRDRALEIWQALLDGPSDKVVTTRRGRRSADDIDRVVVAGDVFTGVRPYVMGLIRDLPDRGLERYRERMEPRAKRLLKAALREGEEDALRECARRFALTESGRKAHVALTDLLLESGRFDEARAGAQALRTTDTSADPQLVAREAWALWGAHRTDDLRNLAHAFRTDLKGKTISVRGESVAVSEFVDGLLAGRKDRLLGPLPALQMQVRRAWERAFMRNAGPDDPWSFDETDPTSGYPVVPAVDGDVLYYSDGLFLRARRLISGTDVWPPIRAPYPQFEGMSNKELQYHVVVDHDLVFAYLTGEPMLESYWSRRSRTIPSHKLLAVERKTGRVRWSHGRFVGRNKAETEFIERLSICQPPVVVGDTIYAAGTQLKGIFHHWICAFERDTGRVRWKTYTGAGQTALARGGNPRIACIPGFVREHEGILYYTTNMGIACAVDSVTGAIIWQAAYAQDPLAFLDNGWGRRRYTPQRDPVWRPSSPAVHGQTVFFGMSDASPLLAADIGTGVMRTVPRASRYRDFRNRSLIGVHHGLLLVAGAELVALDPVDFSTRWTSPIMGARFTDPKVRGRPTVYGSELVLTTVGERAEIHRVDVATGVSLERDPLRDARRVGNVVLNPAAIVIGTAESIAVYVR